MSYQKSTNHDPKKMMRCTKPNLTKLHFMLLYRRKKQAKGDSDLLPANSKVRVQCS